MTDVVLYHGSPNPNIHTLLENSYVSMFPHIAQIFGLYFTPEHPAFFDKEISKNWNGTKKSFIKKYKYGRTWKDDDLKCPYMFTTNIQFKHGRKPDGEGSLYKVKTTYENIIFHKNYPYEMTLKNKVKVEKITSEIEENTLIFHSKKLSSAYDEHYWGELQP